MWGGHIRCGPCGATEWSWPRRSRSPSRREIWDEHNKVKRIDRMNGGEYVEGCGLQNEEEFTLKVEGSWARQMRQPRRTIRAGVDRPNLHTFVLNFKPRG